MQKLTLEVAEELVAAARKKTRAEFGRPICIAVCDAAGFLIAFVREEGAPLRSIAISQGKAYTAARMGVSTAAFHERVVRENIRPADFCDERLTSLAGGAVLKAASGEIVGAAGISGLTAAEDQVVADFMASALLSRA